MSKGYNKGELCNRNGCVGIIDEHENEGSCSCHINPPCSNCVESRSFCPVCNWDGYDEQKEKESSYTKSMVNDYKYVDDYIKKEKDRRGLFYEKYRGEKPVEKLEIIYENHTYSSMIKLGVFPEGTETPESILPKVVGTFGGRFEHFGAYKFKYIAYTD